MKVYDNLAPYYDRFMDHINYEGEAESIYRFLFETDKRNGRVLDIGAGSGGHLLPLLKMGIKTDGLDYSEGMIEILQNKVRERHLSARLYTADMRDFETEQGYDVIYCFGETLHHLEDIEDAAAFMRCAHRALKDDGYLLFTWQESDYFYDLYDCGDFYDRHGDDYLLWNTELNEEEVAAYLRYTAFVRDGEKDIYHRIEETHRLAIFTVEEIADAVKETGFAFRDDLEDLCFSDHREEQPYKHITVLEKI